jgi:hypothetical protein
LRELGYVEGQNILVEGRWYGERTDRLPALAGELAHSMKGFDGQLQVLAVDQ